MKSMNRVFLIGYLGQTPELQISKSGRPYARLNVATHRRWRDSDEEVKSLTDWHSVFVWGRLAERCAESLNKGSLVLVEGALTYWQADSSGPYRNAIHGYDVRFLDSRKSPGTLSQTDDLDIREEAGNHDAVAHLS